MSGPFIAFKLMRDVLSSFLFSSSFIISFLPFFSMRKMPASANVADVSVLAPS